MIKLCHIKQTSFILVIVTEYVIYTRNIKRNRYYFQMLHKLKNYFDYFDNIEYTFCEKEIYAMSLDIYKYKIEQKYK